MGLSFVAIWCTGYPAAKIIVGHSGPFTALSMRFALAALIFGVLALVSRVRWPGWRAVGHSAVVGCLQLAHAVRRRLRGDAARRQRQLRGAGDRFDAAGGVRLRLGHRRDGSAGCNGWG